MERTRTVPAPAARASSRAPGERTLAAIAALCAFALTLSFVFTAPPRGESGLPMDDAYIHLAFARNLALHGEIAFNHGEPAAGTTSLGWDLLLAPAFRLGVNPVAWALVLSAFCQALACFAFARLAAAATAGGRFPRWTPALAAFLFATSGPLLWYGSSGMETSLFLAAGLMAIERFARGRTRAAAFWCGLAVFMRFDGLLLAAVLAFLAWRGAAARDAGGGGAGRSAGRSLARAALPLLTIPAAFYLPAFLSNLLIERSPFPSTLLGRVMLQNLSFTPFDPSRLPKHVIWWAGFAGDWIAGLEFGRILPGAVAFADVLLRALAPVGALMVGGLFVLAIARRGRAEVQALLLWAGLTALAYGCVLPGIAYAGRYEPMIVPLLLWAAALAAGGIAVLVSEHLPPRAARVLTGTFVALLAAQSLLGLFVWREVRRLSAEHITRVHVAMGRSVRALPASDVVAAFDVGAIKHANPDREIVDWAGLTDSAMRQAIRRGRGAEYLRSKRVAYLAVMEGPEGTIHRYPFDLAVESREGRMSFTQQTSPGGPSLPSFTTPPEVYARFIPAVLVAECRMSLYRVEWR